MGRHSRPARDLAQLYREAIRRHAADPVGYRRAIEPTHRHEEYNPLCGDRIEVALQLRDARIEAAAFDGEACAICMASASLLCSLAPDRTVPELQALSEALHQALGDVAAPQPSRDRTEDALVQHKPPTEIAEEMHALLGVKPYPSRVRCATLPWVAAVKALAGTAGEQD